MKEVKHKLQMLSNSVKMDEHQLLGDEHNHPDSGEDSGEEHIEPKQMKKKGKKKKTTAKKKAIKNNFMD